MSDKRNKWNPMRFTTARGVFYGQTYYKHGSTLLRSSSLADRLVGDRVVMSGELYEIEDMWRTMAGSPIAELRKL